MVGYGVLTAVAFIVGLIAPMVGLAWYSLRSDRHSPQLVREDASEGEG